MSSRRLNLAHLAWGASCLTMALVGTPATAGNNYRYWCWASNRDTNTIYLSNNFEVGEGPGQFLQTENEIYRGWSQFLTNTYGSFAYGMAPQCSRLDVTSRDQLVGRWRNDNPTFVQTNWPPPH